MPKNTLLDTVDASFVESMVSPGNITFKGNQMGIVPLSSMADAVTASNNCWHASEAVLEAHLSDFQAVFEQVFISGIQTPAGNHYAILGGKGEHQVIIDYTARQFDKDAPFPLVMDAWQWQSWVEEKIGRQGNWMHDDSFYSFE